MENYKQYWDVHKRIKDVIEIKSILSRVEQKADKFQLVCSIASLVYDIAEKGILEEENPLATELKELGDTVITISKETSQQFEESNAFITEHDIVRFHTVSPVLEIQEIDVPTANLMRLMSGTMKDPDQYSIGMFRKAWGQVSPKDLAYKFLKFLKNDSTNPLKMAVKADELMKRATFTKWKKFIETVLCQLVFIEFYTYGMFCGQNGHEPSSVLEDIKEVQGIDSFGILVFFDCAETGTHAVKWKRDLAICSFHYGKCNIVVFKSTRWNHITDDERDKFEIGLKLLENEGLHVTAEGAFSEKHNFQDRPGEIANKYLSNWGFVAMVAYNQNLHFRCANMKNRLWPGSGAKVPVVSRNLFGFVGMKFCTSHYWVLAGYE
uniref:Uncharacterized protein n=1 Tax=Caenorhabditis japonica TaxID=281687 RepID=A0A8R1I2Y8_CAEJA